MDDGTGITHRFSTEKEQIQNVQIKFYSTTK